MIEYSEEDLKRFEPNLKLMPKILEAKDKGDYALAAELRKQAIISVESLLALRDTSGPEFIIENELNDSKAVRLYGKDWLYDESL